MLVRVPRSNCNSIVRCELAGHNVSTRPILGVIRLSGIGVTVSGRPSTAGLEKHPPPRL